MLNANDHMLDYVDAYLHRVLSEADSATLEAHCQACPICRVALDEARKRLSVMQSLPVVEASESLIRRTERLIAERGERRFGAVKAVLATAAIAALFLAGLHIYYLNLSPSPFDLRVLGQTEVLADSDASLRVVLADRRANRPLADVPVNIELTDKTHAKSLQLASFRTDGNGTANARLRWPDWDDGDYELRVVARPRGGKESISRNVKLKRDWQLMLSTDKPVYQPGQTIHVRSLALRRPDLKPVAGHDVLFSIADPKGNIIFKRRDVTSRFGIAAADCALADEIIEGEYQVRCEMGQTRSVASVEVKKYVLPKFKIDVELDRPYYEPGAKVSGHVRTSYFFGKPVENADVEIVPSVSAFPGTLPKLRFKTNESGKAEFELVLPEARPPGDSQAADGSLTLGVTVRDSAGQHQTKDETRPIAAQPIRIEVLPEAGRLVRNLPNTVYFLTTYPDGRPAQTRIVVSGFEYEIATDELGAAEMQLTPQGEPLAWTVRATDAGGEVGRKQITLECGSKADDFLLRADKAVYSGGETIRLSARGAGNEPVFVDFLKDGQTIATDSLSMTEGRGEYEYDPPAELFGTIELLAYRYAPDGSPIRKRRVLFIEPARALSLRTALDSAEYRPGGRAKLTIELTDERGKPAPGAVSLAAVDEAVFSVLPERPGMERSLFNVDAKLLKPVLDVAPWAPNAAAKDERDDRARFERALFSRTTTERANDREKLFEELKLFLDGSLEPFRVLERPDWEQLAEYTHDLMPKELMQALRGENSSHSLSASTYPLKSAQIEERKRRGLESMGGLWGFFFGALLIGSLIALVIDASGRPLEVIVAVVVLAVLAALSLPAVQQAREAARRPQAINDLREIGLAFANQQSVLWPGPKSVITPSFHRPNGTSPPRLRQWFPETLLWRPEVITDDRGRATLEIDLADSITNWRLSASAVSAEGRLGAEQSSIRVFQPFFVDLNLPVALTRGDEITLPVVVYNYLDAPQHVELQLADNPAFEQIGNTAVAIDLEPREVRSLGFRIAARRVGRQTIEVTASAGSVSDAIRREVEVVPDGRRVEHIANGNLQQPAEIEIELPEQAIEGSGKAIVKLYPSTFSQLVEGLDGIFQLPSGCFEQTSSTTYPNILALDYLRRTNKNAPEIEAKAREYIHLG